MDTGLLMILRMRSVAASGARVNPPRLELALSRSINSTEKDSILREGSPIFSRRSRKRSLTARTSARISS